MRDSSAKSPTAVFGENRAPGRTDVIRRAELLWPSEILNGNTTHAQLRAAGHWEANGGAVLRGVLLSYLSCTPTAREWQINESDPSNWMHNEHE